MTVGGGPGLHLSESHPGFRSYTLTDLALRICSGDANRRARKLLVPSDIDLDSGDIRSEAVEIEEPDEQIIDLVEQSNFRFNYSVYSSVDESERHLRVLGAADRCVETIRTSDGWLITEPKSLASLLTQVSTELAGNNRDGEGGAFLVDTAITSSEDLAANETVKALAVELDGASAQTVGESDFQSTHVCRAHSVSIGAEIPSDEELGMVSDLSARVLFVGVLGKMFTLLPVGRDRMLAQRLSSSQVFELLDWLTAAQPLDLPLVPSVEPSGRCARAVLGAAGTPSIETEELWGQANVAVLNKLSFLTTGNGLEPNWPWIGALLVPELTIELATVSEATVGAGTPERRQISIRDDHAVLWTQESGLVVARNGRPQDARQMVDRWYAEFTGAANGGVLGGNTLRFSVDEVDQAILGTASHIGQERVAILGAMQISLYYLASDSMVRGREVIALNLAEYGVAMGLEKVNEDIVFGELDMERSIDYLFDALSDLAI